MDDTSGGSPSGGDFTQEELDDGALTAVALYDVDHSASFLVPLQPEWWLPLQDDPEAFETLQTEICEFVPFRKFRNLQNKKIF